MTLTVARATVRSENVEVIEVTRAPVRSRGVGTRLFTATIVGGTLVDV